MGFLNNIRRQQIFQRLQESSETPALGQSVANVRRSKIAVRGTDELFFAHRSSIRCTKVSQSESYKLLDTPEIDFDVSGVLINSSGTLLAVYNESHIVVVSLPSSTFMSTEESLIKVKSFRVGVSSFKVSKIVEITWNPCARFDSGLVVLSSDGFIRSFDLSTSMTVPDAEYDLKSPSHNRVGLVQNSISDPVSMTFGSSESLSGALTLYILNDNGDVFSIYPFIPDVIVASKDQVEDLLNETVLLTNSAVDGSDLIRKRQVIEQLKFVNYIWRQTPTSQKELRGTTELCVLTPQSYDYTIQGPFATQPFPEPLYDNTAVNIVSVKTGPVSVLAVSYSRDGFAILLPDPQNIMSFRDTAFDDPYGANTDEVDDRLVLTLLDFKSSSKKASGSFTVVEGVDLILQRSNEIFEIDLSKWSALFNDVYITRDASLSLASYPASTVVRQLKSLSTTEHFVGVVRLTNEFGERFRCLVTDQSYDVFEETVREQSDVDSASSERLETPAPSKLAAPFFEIEKLVDGVKAPKISAPPKAASKLSNDETTLRGLNDVSSQVLKHLISFHRLGLALNYRLVNQKAELERQVDTSLSLMQRQDNVNSKFIDDSSKIKTAMSRQEAITKRFQKLAENLQTVSAVPLSTAERSWFKEIGKLSVNFNKFAKQNYTLREQLRFIKSELDTKSSSTSNSVEGLEEWDAINKIMSEGREILMKTSQGLDDSLSELGTRLQESKI